MDLNDVSLVPADEDRVDRLVDRTSFDRDEAEAIVRFANVDAADRDPSQIRAFVSTGEPDNGNFYIEDGFDPDACDSIRRAMGKASRPKTVIDAHPDKHPSVIFRHATGRCDHEGDADPVTSPRIESDECREMRVDFQTGDTVEDIRAAYNRSANAVVKHVFGRCDHDLKAPRRGRELSESLCYQMRRAYRENDTATFDDMADAFLIHKGTARSHLRGTCRHDDKVEEPIPRTYSSPVDRQTCNRMRRAYDEVNDETVSGLSDAFGPKPPTVHRHLTGKCGHRDDAEEPIASNGADRIEKAECDRMRAAFDDGTTSGDLAADFDRDPSAVRKHVFGRCRHGESRHEATQDGVGPTLCKAIRHEYRTRGIESVASVIDRLNTPKVTFYHHLKGKCSHDHDVEPVYPND
jgi:hypothetical protein